MSLGHICFNFNIRKRVLKLGLVVIQTPPVLAPHVLVDEVGVALHLFVAEEALVILEIPLVLQAGGQLALNSVTLADVTVYLQVVALLEAGHAPVDAGAVPLFGDALPGQVKVLSIRLRWRRSG